MQCGPIRHRVDALAQAAARPFQHVLIPRTTAFNVPPQAEAERIQRLDARLAADAPRNDLIVAVLLEAWGSERATHALAPERTGIVLRAYGARRLDEAEQELLPDFLALYSLADAVEYVASRVERGAPAERAPAPAGATACGRASPTRVDTGGARAPGSQRDDLATRQLLGRRSCRGRGRNIPVGVRGRRSHRTHADSVASLGPWSVPQRARPWRITWQYFGAGEADLISKSTENPSDSLGIEHLVNAAASPGRTS